MCALTVFYFRVFAPRLKRPFRTTRLRRHIHIVINTSDGSGLGPKPEKARFYLIRFEARKSPSPRKEKNGKPENARSPKLQARSPTTNIRKLFFSTFQIIMLLKWRKKITKFGCFFTSVGWFSNWSLTNFAFKKWSETTTAAEEKTNVRIGKCI